MTKYRDNMKPVHVKLIKIPLHLEAVFFNGLPDYRSINDNSHDDGGGGDDGDRDENDEGDIDDNGSGDATDPQKLL